MQSAEQIIAEGDTLQIFTPFIYLVLTILGYSADQYIRLAYIFCQLQM